MSKKGDVWVDVTTALENGVKSLNMGEMVSVPGFDLHEAVSAAEIDDPRMDPPLQHDMHKDALVEKGLLELDLSPAQEAALLDELLVKLVQWWTGHPPYLTVYTSLHLAARERIPAEKPVLRAIVDVVQALVDVTRDIYHFSGVITEEDTPLGMFMDHHIPNKTPQPQTSVPTFTAAAEALHAADDSATSAVACRLELIHSLCCAVSFLIQASPKALDKARMQLQQAKAALEAVSATQAAVAGTKAPGMYPDLYLMFLSAPTQTVQPLSADTARTTVRTCIDCMLEACNLRALTDFRDVMLLAEHVAASCDVAVFRGALYMLMLPPSVVDEDELPDWSPTPRKFAQQLYLPYSLTVQVPHFKLFLDQMSIAIGNYLQSICHNRARMRRRLSGNFQDWSRMLAHARNADTSAEMNAYLFSKKSKWDLRPEDDGPCSLWIGHLASSGMLQFLLLGFELELYSPAEYIIVFNYCIRVLDLQTVSLQRMAGARPKELRPPPKKGKQKAAPQHPEITADEFRRMTIERHYVVAAEAMRTLCMAYLQLCAAVEKIGVVKHPKPAFGSDELRYEQRFQCFTVFTSSRLYVPYEIMKAELDPSKLTGAQLLDLAQQQFKEAEDRIRNMVQQASQQKLPMQHWEEGDWKATAQVAKRNFTVCGLLKMSIDQISSFSGSWEQTTHKQLPTLSIKRV